MEILYLQSYKCIPKNLSLSSPIDNQSQNNMYEYSGICQSLYNQYNRNSSSQCDICQNLNFKSSYICLSHDNQKNMSSQMIIHLTYLSNLSLNLLTICQSMESMEQ